MRILGIYYSHNEKIMHDYNVAGKIGKIKALLNSWHARGLTMMGKIMIVKSLGISQIVYQLINTQVPKKSLEEIDKMIYQYLWNYEEGKGHKVKIRRTILIQDYTRGGLKSPDIYVMAKNLKLKWILRLQEQTDALWKRIIMTELEEIGGLDYLLGCNYDSYTLKTPLNEFWRCRFEDTRYTR